MQSMVGADGGAVVTPQTVARPDMSAQNLHIALAPSDAPGSYPRTMDHGEPQRVLVVEDEPTINQAVADRLAAEGFAVSQSYDGPGAVARAQEWRPDLVVLDVMVPGFDGLEVC